MQNHPQTCPHYVSVVMVVVVSFVLSRSVTTFTQSLGCNQIRRYTAEPSLWPVTVTGSRFSVYSGCCCCCLPVADVCRSIGVLVVVVRLLLLRLVPDGVCGELVVSGFPFERQRGRVQRTKCHSCYCCCLSYSGCWQQYGSGAPPLLDSKVAPCNTVQHGPFDRVRERERAAVRED